MPSAPRPNSKATRIAFSIVGIPQNMREYYKGYRVHNNTPQIKDYTVERPVTNAPRDGGFYRETL